jgi:hypothetical protein
MEAAKFGHDLGCNETCLTVFYFDMADGNQSKNEEAKEFDPKLHREKWLKRLADEIEKIKPFLPVNLINHEDENPQWVLNVEREFSLALLPAAKLRDPKYEITPKRMGSLIGHMCELAVWMAEWLEEVLKNDDGQESDKLTDEEIKQAEQFAESFAAWYRANCRLAKLALCSSVDQTYENMSNFLLGYADGFSHKPNKFGFADIGTTTTEIYQIMLVFWRAIEQLDSVREFHEWLVKIFGAHRMAIRSALKKSASGLG